MNSIHRYCEKRFQKGSSYELMEKDQIFKLIHQGKHLKHKFNGVYAVKNFSLKLSPKSFFIVKASPAASIGLHWVVLAKRNAYPIVFFADPLVLPIQLHRRIFERLRSISADTICVDIMEDRREDGKPLQCSNSQMREFFAYT